ncbi:MAG: hypothetical protein R3F61_08330 [Myxococcota bacterium]
MSDTPARILAALALLGALGNAVLLWRTSGQLASVQSSLDEVHDQRATTAELLEGLADNPDTRGARAAGSGDPDDPSRQRAKPKGKGGKSKSKSKRDAPDAERRIGERREAVRNALLTEVGAFTDEYGIDATVRDELVEEILALRESSVLIRDEIRDERISNFEGREELRALRDDSDARLVELLGEDDAKALKIRLSEERPARRAGEFSGSAGGAAE